MPTDIVNVTRLSRRGKDYAEIRDVRGASILLSRSILQFLIPGAW